MFCKRVQYCLLLTILVHVCSKAQGKLVRKRDIRLQTCIQSFDVHKDKIIRTQDSKEMGAKYINEIDLGSREECLRLCCEMDNCDVFVFEEKNSGSCYLFQCGPPEDFKCKFTHHANYSSAILTINRHVPDLEKQIKLTKHEEDLNKLRMSSTVKNQQVQKVAENVTTVTTITNTIKASSVPTLAPPSNSEQTNVVKCSRYQFECRSTKECIAIYNACDGIPQCADGSDEAYELGCPETTTKSIVESYRKQGTSMDISSLPKDGITQNQHFSPPELQRYFPQTKHQDEYQAPNPQRSEHNFIRPNSQISVPLSYDNNQAMLYPRMEKPQGSNWVHHAPANMGQQFQQYDDNNRPNYKENSLPVAEGQEISRSRFEDVKGEHKSSYGAYQFSQQYEDKWNGNNRGSRFHNENQYVPEGNQNLNQAWVPQTNNQEDESGPAQDQLENWKQEISTLDHEHEKMAHELKHSKELMGNTHSKVSGNAAKIEKFETHGKNEHIQYAKVTQYKVDLEDGIAETPGGAVLSLTLGLIITCVMALLIGCRLRIVRRRIRRGGKSYAHDADYLVNGMYL